MIKKNVILGRNELSFRNQDVPRCREQQYSNISLFFFTWRKTLDIDMNDSRPKKNCGVRFLSIDRWPEASTRDPTTITWSALVNIRRKVLLSSVGFRKRMTSRSPRKLICDSSALRSSISDLFDFCWQILSHFFDHSSIDSNQFKQEDATASV